MQDSLDTEGGKWRDFVIPKPIRTNIREIQTWTPTLPYTLISNIHPSIRPSIHSSTQPSFYLSIQSSQSSAIYSSTHVFTHPSFLSFIIHPSTTHLATHQSILIHPPITHPITHPSNMSIFSFSHLSILPSFIPPGLFTYLSICQTIHKSFHPPTHSTLTTGDTSLL